jgi:hypothetical protein
VSVAELRGQDGDSTATAERSEAFEALRLALTGHPAIATVLGDEPGQLTSDELQQLRQQHEPVWTLVHGSRYSELAPALAGLIPNRLSQIAKSGM